MKCDVIDLANKKTGTIDLDEAVFGVEVRRDLLARTVNWQLDKRQSGDEADLGGFLHRAFRAQQQREAEIPGQ